MSEEAGRPSTAPAAQKTQAASDMSVPLMPRHDRRVVVSVPHALQPAGPSHIIPGSHRIRPKSSPNKQDGRLIRHSSKPQPVPYDPDGNGVMNMRLKDMTERPWANPNLPSYRDIALKKGLNPLHPLPTKTAKEPTFSWKDRVGFQDQWVRSSCAPPRRSSNFCGVG